MSSRDPSKDREIHDEMRRRYYLLVWRYLYEKLLDKKRKILEVGYGQNVILLRSLSQNARILNNIEYDGVDKSREAYTAAEQFLKKLPFPHDNLRVFCTPVERMRKALSGYDDIIAVNVIHHIPPLARPDMLSCLNSRLKDKNSGIWFSDTDSCTLETYEPDAIHFSIADMRRVLAHMHYGRDAFDVAPPPGSDFWIAKIRKRDNLEQKHVNEGREVVMDILKEKVERQTQAVEKLRSELAEENSKLAKLRLLDDLIDSHLSGLIDPVKKDEFKGKFREEAETNVSVTFTKLQQALLRYFNCKSYLEKFEKEPGSFEHTNFMSRKLRC